jgi:hypothetical protein
MVGKRSLGKWVGVRALILSLVGVQACFVLIPLVVIRYMSKPSGYTAEAEIRARADKAYAAAVALAEEKDVKILERSDSEFRIEVTDGTQKASFKAVPVSSGRCKVTVTANLPKMEDRKEAEKELALRVIQKVCERLGVRYSVTKG